MYVVRGSANLLKHRSVLPALLDQHVHNSSECKRAVTEAEKIIGYPTSFLNLRWLLSDEVANVAVYLRKLVGTNHPLLKTAKNLLLQNDTPSWGLIVLLVSKAGGQCSKFSTIDKDVTAGVLHSQRILAEVTEMLRTSNLIHRELVNTKTSTDDETMLFGNKLALLTGDYLLSTSYRELASLRNQELNELISSGLRDLSEGEFIGPRDNQNRPLPAKPNPQSSPVDIPDEFGTSPLRAKDALGNAEAEWTYRNILSGSSLLAKGCQGALKLAGHEGDFLKLAHSVGKHFGLTWQAAKDLENVASDKRESFSLVSAPVLFHLQHDADLYSEIERQIDSENDINYYRLRKLIHCGPGLEKTRQLVEKHCKATCDALDKFPECDAQIGLKNIVNSFGN